MVGLGSNAMQDLQLLLQSEGNPLASNRAVSNMLAKYGNLNNLVQKAAPQMGMDPQSAMAKIQNMAFAKEMGAGSVKPVEDPLAQGAMSKNSDYEPQVPGFAEGGPVSWGGTGDVEGEYAPDGDQYSYDKLKQAAAQMDAIKQNAGYTYTPDDPRKYAGPQVDTNGLASLETVAPQVAPAGSGGIVPPASMDDIDKQWANRSSFDRWSPVMAAGLGILASKEPGVRSLGGALEGLKQYQQQKGDFYKQQVQKAQLSDYAAQAKQRDLQGKLLQRQMDQEDEFFKLWNGQSGNATGAPAPNTVVQPSQNGGQASAQPGTGSQLGYAVGASGGDPNTPATGEVKGNVLYADGKPIFDINRRMQLATQATMSSSPRLQKFGETQLSLMKDMIDKGWTLDAQGRKIMLPGQAQFIFNEAYQKAMAAVPAHNAEATHRIWTEGARENWVHGQQRTKITVQDPRNPGQTIEVDGTNADAIRLGNEQRARLAQQAQQPPAAPPGGSVSLSQPPVGGALQPAPAPAMPSQIGDMAVGGRGMPQQQPAIPQAQPAPAPAPAPQPAPQPQPGGLQVGKPELTPMAQQNMAEMKPYAEKAREQYEAAKIANFDVNTALKLAGGVDTNALGEHQLKVARMLKAYGVDDNWIKKNIMDPVKGETLDKALFRIQSSAVRAMGAREPGSVLAQFVQRYPNLEMRPETNLLLLNLMKQQHEMDINKYNALNNYRDNTQMNGSVANFEKTYNEANGNNTNGMIEKAFKQSGMVPTNDGTFKMNLAPANAKIGARISDDSDGTWYSVRKIGGKKVWVQDG